MVFMVLLLISMLALNIDSSAFNRSRNGRVVPHTLVYEGIVHASNTLTL